MRFVSKTLFSCFLLAGLSFLVAPQVLAANKTVCAVGCDYQTIGEAFSDVPGGGDILQVIGDGASPYDTSAESWPINFPNASTTVMCTGGAVISQSNPLVTNRIYLSEYSAIQGCTFGGVDLATVSLSSDPISGVRISNNVFSTTATSTIHFIYGGQDFTIENNTNINSLTLDSTSTNGLIQGNTFYGRLAGSDGAVVFNMSASSTNIRIVGNTFENRSTAGGGSMTLVNLNGENLTFATNTLRYPVDFSAGPIDISLLSYASGTNYIGGNFIDSPLSPSCTPVAIQPSNTNPWSASYTLLHNTVRVRAGCSANSAISLNTQADNADTSLAVIVNYNLLYNATGDAMNNGVEIQHYPSNSFSQSNNHNGGNQFTTFVKDVTVGMGASDVTGPSVLTSDPLLKVLDADTTNDLQTAPFSGYLDVNGAEDIGATSAVRRSTITIDDTGTVDYLTVDATTTSQVNDFIRTGDSITLAAGSYTGFSVSSTWATSDITITGAGNSTIVTAASGADAILLKNVTTSTLSGVRLTGATVGSSRYTIRKLLLSFSGTDYADAVPPFGVAANTMLVLRDTDCDVDFATADGYDVTSLSGGGVHEFHIALVDVGGGFKETMLIPGSMAANATELNTICAGGGISTDLFIQDVFQTDGASYTYNPASLVTAGATLLGGITTPPAISAVQLAYAGLRLNNASGWTLSNVTSTGNLVGVLLEGDTGDATLSDSVIQSSTLYDLESDSSATNTFDNVSFTRASSTISGAGGVLVKYKLRVRVTDVDGGLGVSGMSASSTDAAATVTSFGTTNGTGYTSYLHLPAFVIDSAGSGLTHGGYNPYVVNVGSLSGYSASSSAAFTLSSRDQLVSIAAIRTAPSAPSGIAVSSITSSTADATWADNATNNFVTLFDFANITAGETFPTAGLTELSENAIGTGVVGLRPNAGYQFRVAAQNAGGISAYDTSAVFYTLAATPVAPTVATVSRTSVSVVVPADENSTSTEYAIYSSTLGGYLNGSGAVSGAATWQTSSTWSTLTVGGLTCGTSYAFATIARNVDEVESATSTAATVSTSGCATASSGGGGGAVGNGGGASGSIQTFFNAPVSVVTPILPTPIASPSLPIPPVNQLTPPVVVSDTLAADLFVQEGTTPASRALGAGERAAILRDARETMGREVIPLSDLERIANGQIPLTRNLANERVLAPRALVTFRRLFGHAPNFRNASENLAWNTLMYRIRFPRNLVAERQGIVQFRRLFSTTPQTPFQWSVVRVLGYVR